MKLTGQQGADIVETALELGYRHVDTAQEYDNETMVGEGIAAADVDREDVFLTTKVEMGNLHHDDVIDSVHESLDRLAFEYIDLLLIHGPLPRVPPADAIEEIHVVTSYDGEVLYALDWVVSEDAFFGGCLGWMFRS